MIGRIAKATVRGMLALPWLIGALLLAPVVLLLAGVYAMRAAQRRLELWAVYDGDEAARDKDEWRDG